MRRVNENEVRLLANLVPHVEAGGALLAGDLGQQHNVFKLYWPTSGAGSGSAPRPRRQPQFRVDLHRHRVVDGGGAGAAAARDGVAHARAV